jgi:hypothetical protein
MERSDEQKRRPSLDRAAEKFIRTPEKEKEGDNEKEKEKEKEKKEKEKDKDTPSKVEKVSSFYRDRDRGEIERPSSPTMTHVGQSPSSSSSTQLDPNSGERDRKSRRINRHSRVSSPSSLFPRVLLIIFCKGHQWWRRWK